MTRLIADTELMKRQARQMEDISARLKDIAAEINALDSGISPGSYDGQLYDRVRAIIYDASSETFHLSKQLANSGHKLSAKAQEFEQANTLVGQEVGLVASIFTGSAAGTAPIFGPPKSSGYVLTAPSGFPVNQFEFSSELAGIPLGSKPFNSEIDVSLWEHAFLGGFSAKGSSKWGGAITSTEDKIEFLKGDFGVKSGFESGSTSLGPRAKFSAISAEHSEVLGDRDSGWAGRFQVTAGEVEGFAGLSEGTLGAKAGAKLVSIEASGGRNINGHYVGVVGGIGIEWELGVAIGKKTRLDLGPFTFGLDIGEAIGD